MRPSDFRRRERWTMPTLLPSAGSPRLLDFSFPTRWLQSPRGAHRLHSSAASPMMAGFVLSGRLAAPILCNEAESSSIALRLAGSPHRASPWGLLLSAPVWLHVGHLFDMLITFQINREASLGLAHQITQITQIFRSRAAASLIKTYFLEPLQNLCSLCNLWFNFGIRVDVFYPESRPASRAFAKTAHLTTVMPIR
jgi:hypothetical protein